MTIEVVDDSARNVSKTWRKVTFSVVVPYRPEWVTEPIENMASKTVGPAEVIDSLVSSSEDILQSFRDQAYEPHKYYFSRRIRDAVRMYRHAVYDATREDAIRAKVAERRKSHKGSILNIPEGLSYLGAERREYEDSLGAVAGGEAFHYAVLHFRLDDVTDAAVETAAAWLKPPGGDGARYLSGLLSDIGLGRCLYSWGGFSQGNAGCGRGKASSRDRGCGAGGAPFLNCNRIFVMTFAEVDPQDLRHPSYFGHHKAWTPAQAWLYHLATGGIGIYRGVPPSDTSDAANDGMFCLDATWVRIEEAGMAVMTQPVLLEESNRKHAGALCLLCHSRMLDIVILCLRQRTYLDRNAESEARVLVGKGHWGDEELDRLLDRERSVAAFLNGLWFTEVSGRREATLVLNEFQKVLGTPVLLTELRDEQESLVRVVEVHRRIDNVAMDKARKEQERRREQLEKAVEKRLEIIVLVLTVISTMLALLALVSDPNLGLFAVGFILTGIVALIGGIRVKRLLSGDCEGQERQPCRFVTRRHHRETNVSPCSLAREQWPG
ncbi:hypothetical protein U6W25_01330 [Cutibacterium acnes]